MLLGATSIVLNNPNSAVFAAAAYNNLSFSSDSSLSPYYYRCRNCDTNMTSNTPANQYQKLKLMQKTVRVPSSLYTMNLGSLSAYAKPTVATENVCWNQMSDRPFPSVQKVVTSSGSAYGGNSLRRSLVRSRPGAQSPGGKGVDIKHNSYERRLNRLKGKNALRREYVPPTFGDNIVFNRAAPIYGGKTVSTNIVTGCNCPIDSNDRFLANPYAANIFHVKYEYYVGQHVYAQKIQDITPFIEAIIIAIDVNNYTVQFVVDSLIENRTASQILPYFACNCEATTLDKLYNVYNGDGDDIKFCNLTLADLTSVL